MKDITLKDAIKPTRAAVEEGIVPGGAQLWLIYQRMSLRQKNNLKEDELIGAMIISRAPATELRKRWLKGPLLLKSSTTEFEIGYNAC
jgi:chaperonin GroEL (HSP60 family)